MNKPRIELMNATIQIPRGLHPKTASLVVSFATALAVKLHAAQEKYRYGANWSRRGWADECRQELARHVEKGDPVDVAAYCAFLHYHGERTAAPAAQEVVA